MSESDSSDDEEMQKFREATDTQLLKNDMFRRDNPDVKVKSTDNNINLKSQRYIKLDEHFNDIDVPQATQTFIGKKLTDLIERKITFVLNTQEVNLEENDHTLDIKLLRDSKYTLLENEEDQLNECQIKKPRLLKYDNKLNEDKCQQIAISGHDILAKNDIKHWSNRSKAKVFHYKKGKNQIICSAITK